jgi:predicted acyltransferase
MTWHALWRSVILVALGIFLRSLGRSQTYFTFEDTLTQIGLGYFFLFLLANLRVRYQWLALALILVGYWLAFALYPAPGPEFDWQEVGVPADWPHHLQGFASHWDKNSNLAWAFDTWFLNLFPRERPFVYNGGGYATLSFIPTLGTMILGLIAGGWLQSERSPGRRLGLLFLAGVIGIAIAWALNVSGLCPIVKRIWTPSWTLFSGGLCFLTLAAFYAVIDAGGWRRWAFPLIVVGMNSITAYLMEWLAASFLVDALNRHLGTDFFQSFGEAYEPLLRGTCVLILLWLILYAMYRRKIFLKI